MIQLIPKQFFRSVPQKADFPKEIRKIDQKLSVTTATLVKVPFDLAYWQQIAAARHLNGLPQPLLR